ncbi:MAG: ribosome-associated translation inhibitor RaiA [Bacteroidales bacterium]|jgi:putative sigma-54 modulation protein|nr:ribosome-associated translation inhibitor RaiA [Bacteroidales bacterium]
MKISINSVHFKADQKLEEFITEKVNKLVSTYDEVIGSEITLRLDNSSNMENKIMEIRLKVPGNDLFAKKQCKSFEEATDVALKALRKQLGKHKEKIKP